MVQAQSLRGWHKNVETKKEETKETNVIPVRFYRRTK